MNEFKQVPYLQFKEKLKDHQNQVIKKMDMAFDGNCHLDVYCSRHPAPEELFYRSSTHALIQEDVKKEVGYKLPATISDFCKLRPEYQRIEPRKFKERVYQERRYRKYCYHLAESHGKDLYLPDDDASMDATAKKKRYM